MFGLNSLWVFLVLVAVMVVGYYRFSAKTKKPFEIITGITGFFDDVHRKVEEVVAYIKTLQKYHLDLHERISSVFALFDNAQSERSAVEQRLKQHLTDLVDQRFAELREGLDKQTEQIFHGLDMHRKVLLTEVSKALIPPEPVVQQLTPEPSKDTEASPFKAATELAETPKVDLTQGGQTGFAPEPETKPVKGRGRSKK